MPWSKPAVSSTFRFTYKTNPVLSRPTCPFGHTWGTCTPNVWKNEEDLKTRMPPDATMANQVSRLVWRAALHRQQSVTRPGSPRFEPNCSKLSDETRKKNTKAALWSFVGKNMQNETKESTQLQTYEELRLESLRWIWGTGITTDHQVSVSSFATAATVKALPAAPLQSPAPTGWTFGPQGRNTSISRERFGCHVTFCNCQGQLLRFHLSVDYCILSLFHIFQWQDQASGPFGIIWTMYWAQLAWFDITPVPAVLPHLEEPSAWQLGGNQLPGSNSSTKNHDANITAQYWAQLYVCIFTYDLYIPIPRFSADGWWNDVSTSARSTHPYLIPSRKKWENKPLKLFLVSHELKRKRMSSAESRCKASPECVQQCCESNEGVRLDATGECCSCNIMHSNQIMPILRRQLPGCCFPLCSQRPSAFSLAAQWSSPRWFQPWPWVTKDHERSWAMSEWRSQSRVFHGYEAQCLHWSDLTNTVGTLATLKFSMEQSLEFEHVWNWLGDARCFMECTAILRAVTLDGLCFCSRIPPDLSCGMSYCFGNWPRCHNEFPTTGPWWKYDWLLASWVLLLAPTEAAKSSSPSLTSPSLQLSTR